MCKRDGVSESVLVLSKEETAVLERMVRSTKGERRLAVRAEVVLACSTCSINAVVAARLRLSPQTVGKWRKRFIESRLDGLSDKPRSGAPRRVSDDQVKAVIDKTLQTKPKAATQWSTRTMAQSVGLSHGTIGRIWRAFGLKPHKSESFALSKDPQFVEKVRDIVGLYMNPPNNAVVLCVDEKSQIQALNRTQPILPLLPGQPERRTYDYERNGTTTLFAAFDTATGLVIGQCHRRHRSIEYRKFLAQIDATIDPDLQLHIVADNYATHKTPLIKEWLARHPRFHVHFTPTHSSWLNQVETWFSILTREAIKRGSHTSVRQLECAIHSYIRNNNANPGPFKWTKSADDILASILRFAMRHDAVR